MRQWIVVLLTFLAFVSCAPVKMQMYPGQMLSPDRHATIRGGTITCDNTEGNIGIAGVDGKITGYPGIFYADEVYVLPGKHKIDVMVHWSGFTAGAGLWLVGETGGIYRVKGETDAYKVRLWIENEKTGERTGGIVGSDDEPKE